MFRLLRGLLAVAFACITWWHLSIVEPAVRFWEETVLSLWEEWFMSLVRQAFEETTRFLNGVSAWFLAVFSSNRGYRDQLRRAWQDNSWQRWWGEVATRPSTLNALVAALQQKEKDAQQQSQQTAGHEGQVTGEGSMPSTTPAQPAAQDQRPQPAAGVPIGNGHAPHAGWWSRGAPQQQQQRWQGAGAGPGRARPARRVPPADPLERPQVFVHHSGMGIIDELAKRRQGLIEDAKLAAELAVSRTFDGLRRLIRALLLLPARDAPVGGAGGASGSSGSMGRTGSGSAGAGARPRSASVTVLRGRSASHEEQQQEADGAATHGRAGARPSRLSPPSMQRSKSAHINMANAAAAAELAGNGNGSSSSSAGSLPRRSTLRRTRSYGRVESVYTHAADVSSALEYIRLAGYPHELHRVVTADGYVLQMERIPRTSARGVVFFMHGVLDTSMTWVSGGVTGSQAFSAWESGMDVWLGNSRGNAPREHQDPAYRGQRYWQYNINHMGMHDIAAQLDHIHNVKCRELGAGTVTLDLDTLGPLASSFLGVPAGAGGGLQQQAELAAGGGSRMLRGGSSRAALSMRTSNSDGNLHRWNSAHSTASSSGGGGLTPAASGALRGPPAPPQPAPQELAQAEVQQRQQQPLAEQQQARQQLPELPPAGPEHAAAPQDEAQQGKQPQGSAEASLGDPRVSADDVFEDACPWDSLIDSRHSSVGSSAGASHAALPSAPQRPAAPPSPSPDPSLAPHHAAIGAPPALHASLAPVPGSATSSASATVATAAAPPRSNSVTLAVAGSHSPHPGAARCTTFTLKAKTRQQFGPPPSATASPAPSAPLELHPLLPVGASLHASPRDSFEDAREGSSGRLSSRGSSVSGSGSHWRFTDAAGAVSSAMASAAASAGAAVAAAAGAAQHLLHASPFSPAPSPAPPGAAATAAAPAAVPGAAAMTSDHVDAESGPAHAAATASQQPPAPAPVEATLRLLSQPPLSTTTNEQQQQPAAQQQMQYVLEASTGGIGLAPVGAPAPAPPASLGVALGGYAPATAAAAGRSPSPFRRACSTDHLATAYAYAAYAPAMAVPPAGYTAPPGASTASSQGGSGGLAAGRQGSAPSLPAGGPWPAAANRGATPFAAMSSSAAAAAAGMPFPAAAAAAVGLGGPAWRADSGGAAHAQRPAAPYTLRCVAHSLGGMSVLIYMVHRLREGLLDHHISRLVLLTPAGFHKYLPKAAKPIAWFFPLIARLLRLLLGGSFCMPLYIPTFLGRALTFKLLLSAARIPGVGELMRTLFKTLLDGDISQWDRALQMPHYNATDMPAISLDQVLHLVQLVRSDTFSLYDYGSPASNRAHYGTPRPPEVSADYWRLDVPVHLVAGSRDGIIPPHNVQRHHAAMRAQGVAVSYREFDFGHLDFSFGVKEELRMYLTKLLRM